MAFQWVEIEAFRGFNERQRIQLDASAVIVVGPNGTGKTSFFDAMQWLLLGSLRRLERWRVRKNDEHIVNRYRSSEVAAVEAELFIRGRRVRLRRQGRYNTGLLEWHDADGTAHGDEAERRLAQALTSRPGQDLRQLLMSSALLQQDVVREVLEDKPSERYQHLAALLGLDELGTFETEVRKRADRLSENGNSARSTLQAAQNRLETAQAQVESLLRDVRLADDVRAARAKIIARLENIRQVVTLDHDPTTSAEAALIQNSAQVLGEQLGELLRRGRELNAERSALRVPSDEEMASLARTVEEAEREWSSAKKALGEAESKLSAATDRSSQLTALAVNALKLLGPTCPVCGQDIDENDVEHRLQERVNAAGADALSGLVHDVDAAQQRLASAEAELNRRRDAFAPYARARQQAEQLETAFNDWATRIAGFGPPQETGLRLIELDAIRATDLSAAKRCLEALRVVWSAMGDLGAVLRSDDSDARIAAARAAVRRAEEALPPLRDAARAASEQEEKGKALQRAATRAVIGVSDRRFRRLLPTVQDIYWRLDPHPSFTTFDFELEVYRQRGIATPLVRDVEGSVAGDPLLLFSSSQANVVALSYFLALGWAAGPDALPFVLLDDPLQSMDDVNALGFADLCRHIRRQRQLLVSTHEHRLGSLLQRKLVHGWRESRPTSSTSRLGRGRGQSLNRRWSVLKYKKVPSGPWSRLGHETPVD